MHRKGELCYPFSHINRTVVGDTQGIDKEEMGKPEQKEGDLLITLGTHSCICYLCSLQVDPFLSFQSTSLESYMLMNNDNEYGYALKHRGFEEKGFKCTWLRTFQSNCNTR